MANTLDSLYGVKNELYRSIHKGDLASVQSWIERYPELIHYFNNAHIIDRLNQYNHPRDTFIHPVLVALNNNHLDIARYLICHGSLDLNIISSEEYAPLHKAVIMNDNSLITLLLDNGANVNISTGSQSNYESPLFMAVERGAVDVVELLLARGADPNENNYYQRFPLHVNRASGDDHYRITKALLDHGASPYSYCDTYSVLSCNLSWPESSLQSIILLLEKMNISECDIYNFQELIFDAIDNPSPKTVEAFEHFFDTFDERKKKMFLANRLKMLLDK